MIGIPLVFKGLLFVNICYAYCMKHLKDESGFIGIIAIVIVIMIIGYLVIDRLTSSQTAQDAQETTTDIIQDARDTVEKANEATNKPAEIINDANNLIENIGQ